MSARIIRVCVCTTVAGAVEPRAPRHAATVAALGRNFEVLFVDCTPQGAKPAALKVFEGLPNLASQTHSFPTRASNPSKLVVMRLHKWIGQRWFQLTRRPSAGALSTRAYGLERVLTAAAADVYLAHNAEALLPAWRAARSCRAPLIFDSMEFHSDMGDDQTLVERELVRVIERQCLPDCAQVFAASDQIADALAEEYRLRRPLALYNVPPLERALPEKPARGLALYWRNTVVGFGQRGLEDALVALTKLPADVTLHLQGRKGADGGAAVTTRIAELKVEARVIFHEPYAPEDAVKEAAQHHVGLCLERKSNRNHDLTVSNKMFDYHMAGLAVVAADLPGLRGVIERSRGGLLFQPGSVDDLVEKIFRLREDVGLRQTLARNAREFALREGNREREMEKFAAAFREALPS